MTGEDTTGIFTFLYGWWNTSYGLSGFSPLIQTAFASNIAYAVLIQAGKLQGAYLIQHARQTQNQIADVLMLLAAEGDQYKILHNDGDATRAANMVAESQAKISKLVIKFSWIALFVAIFCLVLLFFCGAKPQFDLSAPIITLLSIVLFLPVPVGLAVTNFIGCKCINEVNGLHGGFLKTLEHVRVELQEKTKEAVDRLRSTVDRKQNWHSFFGHNNKDDGQLP